MRISSIACRAPRSPLADAYAKKNGSSEAAPYWGYTPDLPRAYGYVDPFEYAYPPPRISATRTVVRVVRNEGTGGAQDRGVRVYAGPGVNYSVLAWTGLDEVLVADGTAISTKLGDSISGRPWYRVFLPNRAGASQAFIAAQNKDGIPYVQIEPTATVAKVAGQPEEGRKLRLNAKKDCPGDTNPACVVVWDNSYPPQQGQYRYVRVWGGQYFAVFATKTIADTDWTGIYTPKIHFSKPDSVTDTGVVLGMVDRAWLPSDAVTIDPE